MMIVISCIICMGCSGVQVSQNRDVPASRVDLAKALEARRLAIQTLWARASVQRTKLNRRRRIVVKIWVQRPDHIRMEATGPLNQAIGVLVAHDGFFQMLSAEEGVLYEGPATSNNMARLFGLAVQPPQIIDILLAQAPSPKGEVSRDSNGLFRYRERLGSNLIEVWLDPKNMCMKKAMFLDFESKPFYEAEVTSFYSVQGRNIPKRLSCRAFQDDDVVKIKVRKAKLNMSFPPGTFQIEQPEGVRIEEVP